MVGNLPVVTQVVSCFTDFWSIDNPVSGTKIIWTNNLEDWLVLLLVSIKTWFLLSRPHIVCKHQGNNQKTFKNPPKKRCVKSCETSPSICAVKPLKLLRIIEHFPTTPANKNPAQCRKTALWMAMLICLINVVLQMMVGFVDVVNNGSLIFFCLQLMVVDSNQAYFYNHDFRWWDSIKKIWSTFESFW